MAQLIYCIEDDDNIRELVIYTLQSANYQAEGFENAERFYKGLKNRKPDLILLDIMLPDEDGISILKKLKANQDTRKLPVIMLTAKASEYDKIKGLDLGADDYVAKPFGVMELISRIKAVMRRTNVSERENVLRIGNIELDNEKHIVLVEGEQVSLTYKEFELLYNLMVNHDLVMSREKLLDLVWNTGYEGESRTVDVHIGSLRQKLGAAGSLIQTIRGVGYKIGVAK
ncbi:two-component system, OmpR family, alkaline phosphatase synthesis response regulator PhoP [[Clostridium] polysaccharolyticum]|uniref:Stage 0 sporulation protein A homolog n=1 Tax=[Clostridium] polysaccharolyticum TaxID=29364 RepID=A0A1I0CYY5_9FIRM|nr:response regulator [[Clostridium] polysaccharolyticum]SET25001.1 two-component system, OmpR family, alkaline phosphatase synthesis response regulator PhoP [[Clostridium] polysaccharolyticum]